MRKNFEKKISLYFITGIHFIHVFAAISFRCVGDGMAEMPTFNFQNA